jgi:hypothetical protein
MGQFKTVENYEVSGSQSDHDRAYSSLEVKREIYQLANKHFEWLLKNGGTWTEVKEVAQGLSHEVGFAMLVAGCPAKGEDTRRGISAYITHGGKMEKS